MLAAAAQMQALTMDRAAEVWPVVEHLAAEARRRGADLLVFPEATYPAYHLESVERYRRPDILRTEAVLDRFAALAAAGRLWLVAGLVEEAADRLYNSAAVFDRTGRLLGLARKHFLWDGDHEWFTRGDTPAVFDTEWGRMGVLICADARAPEIPASLAHLGARFIAQPTAWVNTAAEPGAAYNIQPEFLIEARAAEFGVPFVCADKSGREGDALEYVGRSRIVDAAGRLLAEAGPTGGELILAELSPASPRPLRLSERCRARLREGPHPTTRPGAGRRLELALPCSMEVLAASLTAAQARIGRITAEELLGFAPSRCLALDGAQVLLVEGDGARVPFARARAAENRVYVLAGGEQCHLVVSPDGHILWNRGDGPAAVALNLAEADVKQFNPRTHLWAERDPAFFRL